MTEAPKIKVFESSLEELYPMLRMICNYAKRLGFEKNAIAKIELACEETLVNIISYAYPESPGQIHIECSESKQKPGLQILIVDQGTPFNPLKQTLPDPTSEKNNPGGYGVFFILKMMDEVQYHRVKKSNHLKLIKYL